MKFQSRYAVRCYTTDRYDRGRDEVKTFKGASEMWAWCREYLAAGNRKVCAYARDGGYHLGFRRTRVRKIGEYTRATDVPA